MCGMVSTASLVPDVLYSALRELREQRGLTREQLAVQAGLTARTLGNLERGRTRPHRSTCAVLAAALGVPVAELFPAESNAGMLVQSYEDERRAGGRDVREVSPGQAAGHGRV
jgi:transcriptional regulator with XRE-family HTH domain